MAHDPAAPTTRPARKRRGLRRGIALALAAIAALVTACWILLSGQTGVDWMVRELVVRSGGALTVEGATGALIDTVRVRRIVWRGPEATASATDVALTWRPTALWSRGIVVHGLGAQRLALDFEASDSAAVPLPASLALPVEVTIERLGVGQLDWRVGTSRGTIRGLGFGYTGGAAEHRLFDLSLVADAGAMTGEAAIGANAPFPIDGRFAFAGNVARKDARIDVVAAGTLAALAIDARGRAGDAVGTAHAALAPLAAVPLSELAVDVRDVDLAAWDRSLPATRFTLVARGHPADGGITGTFDAINTLAGPVDAGKVPLRASSGRFAWHADVLALDAIDAELLAGGRAAGRARISLTPALAGAWSLDVRDVDLHQIYTPLAATRLAGAIAADLDATRQTFRGNLADRAIAGGIGLEFDAVVADGAIDVRRFRARAGPGALSAHARVAFAGERAFAIDATAARFDPAHFGAFPRGMLDGTIVATGVLAPAWRARVDVAVAAGSKLAGLPLSGTAHGTIGRNVVRDGAIDLRIGSTTLVVAGSVGEAGDRIVCTLNAPRLSELVPLLPRAVPRTLAGALNVKVDVRGLLPRAGIDIVAKGEGLNLGGSLALRALDARVAVAPGTGADGRADFGSRSIRLDVDAKDVVAPPGTFASARASILGTLAQHTMAVAFKSDDLDVEANAHGGLREPSAIDALSALAWSGTLDKLEGRGPWALRLAAPATLDVARDHIRVGDTRLTVADGQLRLAELAWDDGRITTRGTFAAVPVATVARLAGRPLPFVSTLTLGGEWSLSAAPRLNGMLSVRREGGDLWLVRKAAINPADLAVGITTLAADARFVDDAIDATATFRSTRGGSVDAKLSIGAVADAVPGHIAPDAPVALTIMAQLPTLALLQPWVGTAAVIDGRARLEVAANGTMRDAPLAGTLTGEGLRLDAPQYGLHFTDGRVLARFADRRLALEDLSLTAGAGVFRATGTIAAAPDNERAAAGRLLWRADKFRLFNRPDLRLVVSGDGAVALANGKLALTGSLKADEGRIVYESDLDATLGDDVVVKGWSRKATDAPRAADLPLAIDLGLDFGDQFRFAGKGLDTGLRGDVRVTNGPGGFVGKGSIRAVNGTYFAFGQRLIIDPGRLIFDGPLDNPGLDIVALRKNLAVEAGVAVTGTVKVPIIHLTSNPPVPDAEKLSWLVLGQGLDRTSGADVAALQAASAVLLGPNSKPVTATIAQRLGLDDISIKSAASGTRGGARGAPNAEGQVLAVGKRLSENLSIAYEQGLTVATNALRLEYNVTGSLTLRAEAGTVSGVGMYYRRNFE